MGLRALLLRDAPVIDAGKWETGKMPKSAFPLSKNNSLRLGTGWHWRVIRLTYGEELCRILIAFHEGKQNAFAYFGIESGGDTRVVCSLEHHSTHPGWHVHAACDHMIAPLGRLRWPDIRRIPRKGHYQKGVGSLLTKDAVLHRTLSVFRAVSAEMNLDGR